MLADVKRTIGDSRMGSGRTAGPTAASMKEYVKRIPLARLARLANLYARSCLNLPDWQKLIKKQDRCWRAARQNAAGPRVLLAPSLGTHLPANTVDSMLAAALTLRGARVEALLCDQALPACMVCELNWWPDLDHFLANGPTKSLCRVCPGPARRMWRGLGLPVNHYGTHLDTGVVAEAWHLARTLSASDLDSFEFRGVRIGMHSRASTLRFFAVGDLSSERDAVSVQRRYFAAAIIAHSALESLFRSRKYDICVAHHGIYVPQGVILDVARQHGVRVVTWSLGYRNQSLVFSHDDTYHVTLMDEPVEIWDDPTSISQDEWNRFDHYFRSHLEGDGDWITYQRTKSEETRFLLKEININNSRPIVSVFTNVLWDAQITYKSNAFPSMRDWLIATVDYFSRRPDLQLVIRAHPAEVRSAFKSRQTVANILASSYSRLPENICVIPPESPVNAYELARQSNAAIIFATKMGVDLAAIGIPTIVAGESWVRNKGLTYDVNCAESYNQVLGSLPFRSGLDPSTVERARRYAFHFYFRRMISVDALTLKSGVWPPVALSIDSLGNLAPGMDSGLDTICNGILSGNAFHYDPKH